MKNRFLGSLLLLQVIFFQSFAQSESSLLWKISGNGLENSSYVFGTIHIICEDDFMMNETIMEALAGTEKLFLEIDMADPDMMAKMTKISFNEGMKNISEYMDEEEQEHFDRFFKENFGAGLDRFGSMKPFMLSSLVLTRLIPCEQQSSYEQFFVSQAQQNKLKMEGLETLEFQAGLFDQIPIKDQIKDLSESLMDMEKGKKEFEELIQVYLTNDIERIHDHILDSPLLGNYGELLVYERNRNWIPQIEESMAKSPIFVAVGAGHLGSENGVIHLLKRKGYSVEPVKY